MIGVFTTRNRAPPALPSKLGGNPLKEQRCLYCERPLALLSRLTGDGEFCSKEHRRIYQKEHSQLALARLLQAQPAPSGESSNRLGVDRSEPAEKSLAQVPVMVAERPEKKARSKDPQAAGFRTLPAMEARASAVPPAGGLDARWSPLPRLLSGGQQAFPRLVNFVTPGSFLRRPSQPAAPSAYPGNLKRGGVPPAAFSSAPPQARFFDERLRRTERIGFCPP